MQKFCLWNKRYQGNNSEWSGRKARNFCYPGGGATSISDGIFWGNNSQVLRCLLKKVGSRAFLIFVRQNFRAPGNNNYNSAKVKQFENTNFHAICCSIIQSTNTKQTWGTSYFPQIQNQISHLFHWTVSIPFLFRFHHYPRNYEDKQAGPPDGCQLLLLSRLQTKNAFYPFFCGPPFSRSSKRLTWVWVAGYL